MEGKSDEEKKALEKQMGGSPVVLLVFNMVLPVLFAPAFYWLYG